MTIKRYCRPIFQKHGFRDPKHLALQDELTAARLKNIGDDGGGIRTNLAKHFHANA